MASDKFTITAPPGTDIWRKPPSTNSFNAPTHPLLPSGPVPLRTFQRARLTFSGPWTTQYDQAGLLLHLTKPNASASEQQAQQQDRWLKTGIEFYLHRPYLSTVATQSYADWSVTPPAASTPNNATGPVTIEARRETDALGTSLWVYQLVLGADGEEAERWPLRECTWWFAEEGEWNVDVRAMAARPAEKGSVVGAEGLVVEFEGAEVEVK
ncbi:Uncharacterized protein DIS24_g6588 [Lasiodiplodia hormozganensis]|uniref:Uncharacterized protein n=1 Tax=Lasiodiplodia hormozganensis TaxID=869390 RepID=A0AA39YFU8_9PEZI|nr:uncharacterized protein LTHEOB_6911 [Lasiodiplodia theobromae]KAF4543177.1 hypothetical protein LTHEOB_6911 [Lasiodiplodia theobromae]KAK0650711.1 Uncharacterized protein DIS24_g6588 [Lasiodiplodia hormozganensis]